MREVVKTFKVHQLWQNIQSCILMILMSCFVFVHEKISIQLNGNIIN